MTPEIFADVMGNTLPREKYASLLPAFMQAMRAAGCTIPQRAAMWCAQLGHESGGLRFVRELWGPTDAQASYEGRGDLGNTHPGDVEAVTRAINGGVDACGGSPLPIPQSFGLW